MVVRSKSISMTRSILEIQSRKTKLSLTLYRIGKLLGDKGRHSCFDLKVCVSIHSEAWPGHLFNNIVQHHLTSRGFHNSTRIIKSELVGRLEYGNLGL